MAFIDFDTVDGSIRTGTQIGFAFPMQRGAFSVSRFNLDGAPAAVDAMRDLVLKVGSGRTGTRDQRL
jgi:hypothetical protein